MISAIAAVGNNWQIGLDGKLPWPRQKADMDWFRDMTTGKVMIVGHYTYPTVKELDGTLNRILVRAEEFAGPLHLDHIIIGGERTYRQFAEGIDQLYLSRIDYDGPADTYFPINAFTPEQIQNAILLNRKCP